MAPLFLANPTDPEEMLEWRADYVLKMMAYGGIRQQVFRTMKPMDVDD